MRKRLIPEAVLESTLEFVYPLGSGSFIVGFTQNSPSCTNTDPIKYHYVSVGQNGVTAEGLRNMLAASLVALTTEKRVLIAFDDSTSFCFVNRMILKR